MISEFLDEGFAKWGQWLRGGGCKRFEIVNKIKKGISFNGLDKLNTKKFFI